MNAYVWTSKDGRKHRITEDGHAVWYEPERLWSTRMQAEQVPLCVRTEMLHLAAKVAELEAWKESAMAVEAQWDDQAVARELGLPLGSSIRAGILPAVKALKSQLEWLPPETALRDGTPIIGCFGERVRQTEWGMNDFAGYTHPWECWIFDGGTDFANDHELTGWMRMPVFRPEARS